MTGYDYKVLPAPSKGEKAKGVKGNEARFAYAVERLMNDMASEGWDYVRADTLPSEERSGLTQSVTVWRTLLVFRRPRQDDASDFAPRLLDPPAETAAAPAAAVANDPAPAASATETAADTEAAPEDPAPEAESGAKVYEIQPGPAPEKPGRLAPEPEGDAGERKDGVRDLVSFLRSRSDSPSSRD